MEDGMGPDRATLTVRQTDLLYYAALEFPAFDLGRHWVELQSAIFRNLRRFRVRISDIKIESATANPGDASIACWMLEYRALARYRLDRVEAWSNKLQLGNDTVLATDIVRQTMEVLREVSPDSRVAVHGVKIDVHGALQQGEVTARIASYVTERPEGPPPLTPSGVSFQCELASGQGLIVLERSGLVPDGAFLRVTSEHKGSLSEVEALERAIEFFQTATARLGLDVLWGD